MSSNITQYPVQGKHSWVLNLSVSQHFSQLRIKCSQPPIKCVACCLMYWHLYTKLIFC
jgi:hypothetical protein